MREIEVKAKLADKNKILELLQAKGCVFTEPVMQSDVVYMLPENMDQPGHFGNVLRVRKQGDKAIFTLKRNITNELDCLEKEVVVSDAQEMSDIIDLLGFKEFARVIKTRQKTKFDEYEICIDEVQGLGSFIEVEKLVEDNAEDEGQNEIFNFLKEFGISDTDRVMQGYDTLIRKQLK